MTVALCTYRAVTSLALTDLERAVVDAVIRLRSAATAVNSYEPNRQSNTELVHEHKEAGKAYRLAVDALVVARLPAAEVAQ